MKQSGVYFCSNVGLFVIYMPLLKKAKIWINVIKSANLVVGKIWGNGLLKLYPIKK